MLKKDYEEKNTTIYESEAAYRNDRIPPSFLWLEEGPSEKGEDRQTGHVMTARSSRQETGEVFQEQVPLIQISMSVFQIDQSLKLNGEQIVEGAQDNVSCNASHLIGIGRNHRSQWTMVTARMIGIAKKKGNVKMDF